MDAKREREIAREAAKLFLKLKDEPDDEDVRKKQKAFVARGKTEREAYEKVATAWTAARKKTRPQGGSVLAAFLAVGVAIYAVYEPVQMRLLSDFYTAKETSSFQLVSGDYTHLDASSALLDETDGSARVVRLLQGGAFFDVSQQNRAFRVLVGDLTVEVKGTAFEVVHLDASIQIGVAKGSVSVEMENISKTLAPGESLRVTSDGIGDVVAIDLSTIAAWRENILQANGMSIADVVGVIERRVTRKIVVLNKGVAERTVTGRLDLNDPIQALRTMAAAGNANVSTIVPGLIIIRNAD